MRGTSIIGTIAAASLLAGCNAHQSTLAPFGADAVDIRHLFIIMLVGAVVIAAAVALLMRHAVRAPEGAISHRGGMRIVLWLGGIIPTIVLLGLLAYSLPYMRPRPVAPADLQIAVDGEQFWWRVTYRPAAGTPVESANEIRIPTGRTVAFRLGAGDVVHSFWIPGLAGKMDMIPGRTNTLVVRADKPGRYRGQCAEFCGLSHALMAFDVIAMPPAAFDAWLAGQRRPAVASDGEGARLFAANGCGGCHTIAGVTARTRIGPDLTHFGSRRTLAAGILPMTPANVAGFIRHPEKTKPGVRMPSFPQLSQDQAMALTRYLQGLK
ncbi:MULTISPECIES: cytochrome c oxidase subunit II [unclassified Sphingomonas]|uniref:cytochrome c oxidase subunit II n=1 Tax=unclassified Sphingomonas TaxID=196159 RepID=UPI0028623DA4|nr:MULTISPECIES: cytochrome c oxidase subunit II [unclassified Sphingomonas]MDR6115230.1 cytochrome c oxidase subunit 2 [Sphingomonas sp. SORGH_AS_0789]MDR6151095.1 cytochrome c oxidase subunit 2 [Sphingomonas sp. SORGH_AS_0742]